MVINGLSVSMISIDTFTLFVIFFLSFRGGNFFFLLASYVNIVFL